MNAQMAYLLGTIIGNGEMQQGNSRTTIIIDIPHKNLRDDEGRDIAVYVKASIEDIKCIIEPLLGNSLQVTQSSSSTKISFTKSNEDYTMREILRLVNQGARHSSMTMNSDLFLMATDEKISFMRGVADVTGYIRKSNIAYGNERHHRVYLEIPENWNLVIDIANMLKDLDVPIQTIDFGHPNFRDSQVGKYNKGQHSYWKKEHQIKIWANEFVPIGFNIIHKQRALEAYSEELLTTMDPEKTHRYYWEIQTRRRKKPSHPAENDISLPEQIRGKHFESWRDLAEELGYHA